MSSRRIYTGATALLALHIVVVELVAPRAGTGASDHLVPALIPLALLAFGVWLFPRVPAWLQAAMSIVLGIVTLVGGIVAANELQAVPRMGTWTGLLLVPAGIVLISVGMWVLWKARGRGGHRLLRALVLVVAVILVGYIVVLPLGMAIVATQRPVKAVPDAGQADLGRPAHAIALRTGDGLTLRGWYVPSQNGAAVLTFPREWTAPQARLLVKHGYGVLLLDMRGYGDSEGDPNAYGWGSTADVKAGLAFLERRPDVKDGRIGGIGLSVGGEQLIETAAGDGRLKAVVSEGAGERSVRESLVRGVKGWAAVPSMSVQTAALAVLSGHMPPPSLSDLVGHIAPRPLLLVYAENGGGGEELTPQYYAAAGASKGEWLVPGAGHTGGLRARPAEYERRIVGFFDGALLGKAQE